MVYKRETNQSVDEVVAKLQQAAAENQFGVLGLHNLKEKMNAKGVAFERECQVVEVCNPAQAKKVLTANIAISTALPCRISVYEEDGKTQVATIQPSILIDWFNEPDLQPIAQEVEDALIRIIDTACQDR